MEATIAVYDNHKKAINAVKKLVNNGIEQSDISIIGRGEMVEDRMHISSVKSLKKAPIPIGVVAGGVLGVLSGVGMLAIPGLGFMFLAGGLVGGLGGATVGMVGGGLTSIFVSLGFRKDQVVRYEHHLENGHYLVVVNASEEDINKSNNLLHKHADHLELH